MKSLTACDKLRYMSSRASLSTLKNKRKTTPDTDLLSRRSGVRVAPGAPPKYPKSWQCGGTPYRTEHHGLSRSVTEPVTTSVTGSLAGIARLPAVIWRIDGTPRPPQRAHAGGAAQPPAHEAPCSRSCTLSRLRASASRTRVHSRDMPRDSPTSFSVLSCQNRSSTT